MLDVQVPSVDYRRVSIQFESAMFNLCFFLMDLFIWEVLADKKSWEAIKNTIWTSDKSTEPGKKEWSFLKEVLNSGMLDRNATWVGSTMEV